MREILFRGKRVDNGGWVEGYLTQDPDLCQSFIEGWDYYTDGGGLEREPFCHEVYPETVGQFTGLTDKNGKKIFEGDIISAKGYDTTTGVVEFKEYKYVIHSRDKYKYDHSQSLEKEEHWNDGHMHYDGIYEFQVLGNIYDNPELLGDPNDHH